MTSLQVTCFYEVCLKVFTTLMELDMTSETTVQARPIPALLKIAFKNSYLQLYLGRQCQRQLLVTNQGQWPTIVAKADATPPWQNAEIPQVLNFTRRTSNPPPPQTCFEVFQASMGKVDNLQNPAKTDPTEVCTKMGNSFSEGVFQEIVVASILAAVSPKRDIGPITNAGTNPRQNRTMPPSPYSFFRVGRKAPPFLN